jgi:hypothetical protein
VSQQGAKSISSNVSEAANGKLKILISLLYYFPHRTGLTIHVQSVAEELVKRGHEVTVLTARYNQSLPRDTVMHNGVRVVRLWTPPIAISRGMIMPAFPWAALGLMLQNDVISIHTPMLETALISVLAGIAGKTVVCSLYASRRFDPAEGRAERLYQRCDAPIFQLHGAAGRSIDRLQPRLCRQLLLSQAILG